MTNPSTNNGRFPSVVVTSLAATTSIAGDVDATWKGLLNGESGIGVLEDDFVSEYGLPVRIGGEPDDSAQPSGDSSPELCGAVVHCARPRGVEERR